MREKYRTQTSNRSHAICGAVAGGFSKLILQPLDLIRTRFQMHDGTSKSSIHKYSNVRNAFSTIIKTDGILGLYKAATPNIFGSGFAWSLYFFTYGKIKEFFRFKSGRSKLKQSELIFSSSLCGAIVMVITNPIWFLKTRIQIQNKKFISSDQLYKNTFDAATKIFRHEGIFAFYRGIVPAIFLTSTGALQMYFYENARRLAVAVYGKNKLPLHATLPMGALTKSAAACITYPLLLIKARLYQPVEAGAVGGNKNKYKNFSHVATSVIRREGAAGFYKGLTAHLAKTAPGSAITFATYEYLIFLMNARW